MSTNLFFTDIPITQAIARFSKAGKFEAADGDMYPYHVKGIITFQTINSLTTRIQGKQINLELFSHW